MSEPAPSEELEVETLYRATYNMRCYPQTHRMLKVLAAKEGISIAAFLHKLAEIYQKALK